MSRISWQSRKAYSYVTRVPAYHAPENAGIVRERAPFVVAVRCLSRRLHGHAREILERAGVCGDDRPAEGLGGGRDDQVVRTARSALRPGLDEELSVMFGDVEPIGEHGDAGHDLVDIGTSLRAMAVTGQESTHAKLGDCDCGDRDVVVVVDDDIQVASRSFGIDEKGRVKQ